MICLHLNGCSPISASISIGSAFLKSPSKDVSLLSIFLESSYSTKLFAIYKVPAFVPPKLLLDLSVITALSFRDRSMKFNSVIF
jgi:hypothetical protein